MSAAAAPAISRTCRVLPALLAFVASTALAQVAIIQPGAPGQPARELSADQAIEIADTSYSPARTGLNSSTWPGASTRRRVTRSRSCKSG